MEDIRKLLEDHEARIAPDSLAYIVRGLGHALAKQLRDGIPQEPLERRRHLEIVSALAHCMELHSILLARWVAAHLDACPASQ